jgi:hypothetical protein
VTTTLTRNSTYEGTALQDIVGSTIEAAARLGSSWTQSQNYAHYLKEAGFVDIHQEHYQWPLNRWPKGERLKMMGTYFSEDLFRGMEGLALGPLTRGAGKTREEVVEMARRARLNLSDRRIHAYCPAYVFVPFCEGSGVLTCIVLWCMGGNRSRRAFWFRYSRMDLCICIPRVL